MSSNIHVCTHSVRVLPDVRMELDAPSAVVRDVGSDNEVAANAQHSGCIAG